MGVAVATVARVEAAAGGLVPQRGRAARASVPASSTTRWRRTAYERARRIIVSSPLLAEHAAALAPYRERVRVIPFGIDLSRWDPTPAVCARASAIRSSVGSRPLILFAGRMVPYKGVGVLLRAMVGLDGRGDSRRRRPVASRMDRRRPRELQLGDRVRFAGEVTHDELAALYHACDIFVCRRSLGRRRSATCSSRRWRAGSRSSAPGCPPACRG